MEKMAETVLGLWNSGLGAPEIGRELGRGTTTIYRVLKANGIVPHEQNRRLQKIRRYSTDKRTEIASDYDLGLPMMDLQAKYGCSAALIRNACKENGVRLRNRGGRSREMTPAEIAEIQERHTRGESQERIARVLGTSQPRVSRILRNAGVTAKFRGSRWKGGRVLSPSGYVMVMVEPDAPFASMRTTTGYVLEHRLAMAEALGRVLDKTESVHHINGDRLDNRLENLQLRQGKHGKGVVLVCHDCGSRNVGPSEM